MASMGEIQIPVQSLMKHIYVDVVMTGFVGYKIRKLIGTFFIKFGLKILGVQGRIKWKT